MNKPFDLEERTFLFAKNVAQYARQIPKDLVSVEYLKQVVRSSGSVGANYIEANESLSKKDFVMRVKICRKEAKESAYWLRLLMDLTTPNPAAVHGDLLQEALELKKIFSAILVKSGV